MSVNEMNLDISQNEAAKMKRVLGVLALAGAPMLFLQFLLGNHELNAEAAGTNPVIGLLGVLYIGGWICGAIGMFFRKIYGEGLKRKVVFTIQIILLALAFMFSVRDTFGINYDNGGVFFAVCDAGYPLSHLLMSVVGIFTIRAKVWTDFSRFAPLLVGIALPLTFALMPLLGAKVVVFAFGGLTATGLGVIGLKIFSK